MADRNVKVTVRADVADFLRGANLVQDATQKMAGGAKKASQEAKTGLSGMAQSVRDNRDAFGQVGGALTVYGAAVAGIAAAVAKTGIEYNTLRQRSTAALTTLTGSAEQANAQMDKLDDFASNSPFARNVFIEAQQQMFGFGIEAQKVIPFLDAIQNAVAATGGSNQDIAELSTIFSQISASAKITGTDLREFGNRGIDAATIIGSQMGKTGAQIREDITAGTLDAQDALDALAAGMQDRFGGAADNVKNTMLGAVDRVKAAFRDLSSDLMTPLVDPNGGGLAVDGLNKLADAMRALQGLPDGVKNTAAAIGALSGAASLAAGGFLLAAPRIVDTVDALKQLGIVTPGLGDKMQSLGTAVAKGGALVIGLGAVATAIQLIEQESWKAAPGVEELRSAILDMQDTGKAGGIDQLVANMEIMGNGSVVRAAPIDSLADAIKRLDDPGPLQRLEDLDGILPGVSTTGDRAAEVMAALESELTNMVAAGDVAGAMTALNSELEGTGVSTERAIELMPGFKDALIGVENEAREAATATSTLADTMIALPEGVPTKLEQMRAAGMDLKESMNEAADAFVDFSTDVDNAEVSLDVWLDQLLDQAEARDAWVGNMQTLANEGLDKGFFKALQEQGPAGALRVQQMVDEIANGRDVSEFNAMGRDLGLEAVAGITDEMAEAQFPTVDLEAGLDREAFLEDANAMVRRSPEQIEAAQLKAELDLDDQKARLQTAETVLWAAEQTGIMNLDADDFEARFAIDNWNGIAANTTGVTTLDSDPVKALNQVRGWVRDAERTVATSSLDANSGRARGETSSWQRWASGLTASASVSARTGNAYSEVRGLLSWVGRQATSISVSARYTGGLNVGGAARNMVSARASGGVDRRPQMAGPGYGKSNLILWGEPETRGEAFISNHPSYKAQNLNYLTEAASWFGKSLVDSYAAGGMPGRQYAMAPAYYAPQASQPQGRQGPVLTIDKMYTVDPEAAAKAIRREQQDAVNAYGLGF